MIDDGPWAGAPLGGIGAGSIGRTQRGDFARWHLDVGKHRFESIPASQFSVFVDDGASRSAHVLSTIRPDGLPTWGFDLPVGAGTYHALFPYAWFDVDWDELPVRVVQRQFSPVLPHNYRESSYPVAIFETTLENRSACAADRRADAELAERAGPGRGTGSRRRPAPRGRRRDGSRASSLARRRRPRHRVRRLVRASRRGAAGVELSAAPLFHASPTRPVSGRTSPRTGGWTDRRRRRRRPRPGSRRVRRSPRRSGSSPASRGRSRSPSPGTSRSPSSASGRAGTAATRRSSAPPAEAPGDRGHRPPRARGVVRGDRRVAGALSSPTPSRPDWYASALFNELYFMVDGGTLWTDGPPMPADGWVPTPGPTPPRRALRAVRPDRVLRLPLLQHARRRLLRVVRAPAALAGARAGRHPRVRRGRRRPRPRDRRDPVERQAGDAEVPGALPHDVGGPNDDPFLRVNAYRYQDINSGRTSTASSSSSCGGTRRSSTTRRSCATPGRASSRRSSTWRGSIATATGCPSTTATLTRPTTRGR